MALTKKILGSIAWVIALSQLVAAPAVPSPLKDDEEVLLFRTVVPLDPAAGPWKMRVRGWVFEPERNSLVRKVLLKGLAKALGLPSGSDQDLIFQKRAAMFLVDSESRKDIQVTIGTGVFDLPQTGSDGLLDGTPDVPAFSLPGDPPRWVRFAVATPSGDDRRFEGEIQLIRPGGPGVISDIDDTIKVTVVRDKKQMLQNTFLKPFVAVPGMSEMYTRWAGEGAVFHYVSGSPWHLYPSLAEFLDQAGFPAGGFHLRNIWKSNSWALEITSPPESHKIPIIKGILEAQPGRMFIMVGDSGEKDPEVYGEIARLYPTRIRHIYIRKAPLSDESAERYEAAFKDLPRSLWSVFAEPDIPAEL